jgi:hypothetical protein
VAGEAEDGTSAATSGAQTARRPTFYLGTHETSWLGRTDVPLFLSRRRLAPRKTLPRALGPWALDSGGFSELSLFGRWTVSARRYVAEVRRWREEVGNLRWQAAMDWMTEDSVLKRTGRTLRQHQRLTVEGYLELLSLAPELSWVPVLQGPRFSDYQRHRDDYARAGIDLAGLPLVGLGGVCRRQGTATVEDLLRRLAGEGLRVHCFGMKAQGLARAARHVTSADSMAWSLRARRSAPLEGCGHRRCRNCLRFALTWRQRVLEVTDRTGRGPWQTGFEWP